MFERLMEQVVDSANVCRALKAVEDNEGKAGIDGMSVEQLSEHLKRHWPTIRAKLMAGTYTPSPLRRVQIPKPQGGTRMLGIPTVMDRFVQQAMLQVLQPIWDPRFSEHSYGFRPGRSAHDAVRAAREHVRQGRDWVVDMDITKFFDRVHHDILMHRVATVVRDKRLLRLIGKYLRSGAMENGVMVMTEEGTPQGGPLSPLLANIYLDALDEELEQRGLAFVRYADDCNIYVSSERAARRVLASVSQWLEERLRLEVNASKSAAGRPWERQFLGFRIGTDLKIEIAPKSLERFKGQVREKWRSCQSLSSEQLRDDWCAFVRGWWGYYRLAEARRNLDRWEGWIRRHMRKCFWQRWHGVKGRLKKLKRLGVRGRGLQVAHSSKGAWRIAMSPMLQRALNNAVLRRYNLWVPSDLAM